MAAILYVAVGGTIYALQEPYDQWTVFASCPNKINSLRASPNGAYIAAGIKEDPPNTVFLFNTADGALIAKARAGGGDSTHTLAWSPASDLLIVPTRDSSEYVTAYSVPGLTKQWENSDFTGDAANDFSPKAFAFKSDGTEIYFQSDSIMYSLDPVSLVTTEIAAFRAQNAYSIWHLEISPNGQFAVTTAQATGNPMCDFFMLPAWANVAGFTGGNNGRGGIFTPDSQNVILKTGSDLKRIETSDPTNVAVTTSMQRIGAGPDVMAMAPDGSLFAIALNTHLGASSGIQLRDPMTLNVLFTTPPEPGECHCVTWGLDNALPKRKVRTFDYDGNPESRAVRLIDPVTMGPRNQTITGADGRGTLRDVVSVPRAAALTDGNNPWSYDLKPFLLSTDDTDPEIELYAGYTGSLETMSGRVTVSTGGPGDEVVIREWASRKLTKRVYPDSNGYWTADVPPGEYDVTYIKTGCAPVVHGPYEVPAS